MALFFRISKIFSDDRPSLMLSSQLVKGKNILFN